MKGLKRSLAAVLAVMTIVLSSAVPAYATTQSGTNNTFGKWTCGTELTKDSAGKKIYYSYTMCSNKAKLTLETEYQSYPSGKQYKYYAYTTPNYNYSGWGAVLDKTRQSTLWSFHNWKSSSGTGMTRYTELINK